MAQTTARDRVGDNRLLNRELSSLDFYARGLIHPTVESARLDDINEVFGRMERGQIDGRVVIDYR